MKQAIIIVIAHCMVIVSAINEADGEISKSLLLEVYREFFLTALINCISPAESSYSYISHK